MNPELRALLSDDAGQLYGIPYEVYAQGLCVNKELFRQAGLVDEQGNIIYPETLTEMAEFAQIIKERTGKAGFVMPTQENNGGWHFLNIAWNFGAEFIEEKDDGSYKAVFDTPETVEALQYIKDLKWKYNALPRRENLNNEAIYQLFSIGEAAMMLSPPTSYAFEKYGISKDDIMIVGVPKGAEEAYSQMGGTAYLISADSSPEQVEAIVKWIEFIGKGPEINDKQLEIIEEKYQKTRDSGGSVLPRETFSIWLDEAANAKRQEIREKYCNVDAKDYENYYRFSGIQIRPEEEVHCQDLYSVLDKCVYAVITDENADPAALIKSACEEFQTNYLE